MGAGDQSLSEITDLCKPYNAAEGDVAKCDPITISYEQVRDGYSFDYCFKTNHENGEAIYELSLGDSFRGWCLTATNNATQTTVGISCPDGSSNGASIEFLINPLFAHPVTFKRLPSQITDTSSQYPVVYVDKYNAAVLRPSITPFFITTLDTDNNNKYGIYDISVINDLNLGLNTADYTLSNAVKIEDDEFHTVEVKNSNGSDLTTSSYLNFKSVDCEAGYYPIVFIRHYSTVEAAKIECYDVLSNDQVIHSSCIGGDWYTTGQEMYVHEHYTCLPKGDYKLVLKHINNENDKIEGNWQNNSYLTLLALSHKEEVDGNSIDFKGYIIGDFAYTITVDANHKTYYENTVQFRAGPMTCASNENVVVMQKYSTTNGGREGFEVYDKNTNELKYSFFGGASLEQQGFDPYTRVFLCLSGDYRVKLISRASNKKDGDRNIISCGPWSTTKSIEEVTYTNLERQEVTALHPSFMRIDILNLNEYNNDDENGKIPSKYIRSTYEGENFAVLADGKHIKINESSETEVVPTTDIYDVAMSGKHYNCYYEFDIHVTGPAPFTYSDNGNEVTSATTILNKNIGDPINVSVKCNDFVESGECSFIEKYNVVCYKGNDVVDCAAYGFTFDLDNASVTSGASGVFTTPSEGAETIVVEVTSVIKADIDYKTPVTRRVTYNIQAPVSQCNVKFIKQDESITYVGVTGITQDMVTCTLNGENLSEGQYVVSNNANVLEIAFHISSDKMIYCTFPGGNVIVYSEPSCIHNAEHPIALPLYQSVSYSADRYSEFCNEEGRANEYVCAYDPLTKRAEVLNHETVCHEYDDEKPVPPGHGYITGYFYVLTDANTVSDINVSFMPTWMKRLIEDAFENESPVPMRNAYITNITYSETVIEGEHPHNVEITIVFDTAFEYANDLHDAFLIERFHFMDNVNEKLDREIPSYFAHHDLFFADADIDLTPNKCVSITDEEGFDFSYYDNDNGAVVVTIPPLTWNETVIWYYAYNAVPAPYNDQEEKPYDAKDNKFWGAFTRYCKPKYYDAKFLGVNVNSAVQTNVPGVNSLFFTIRITNLDPRSVTTETRYAVARALTRYVMNKESTDASFVELFDFNVHMIEGATPVNSANEVNPSMMYYRDTVFYVQMRARSNVAEQFTRMYENVKSVIDNFETCEVEGAVSEQITGFFNDYFPYEWRADQKDVYICVHDDWNTSNVATTKSLRY